MEGRIKWRSPGRRQKKMTEKTMDVERDEGDPVGITVDSGLVVSKVVPSTLADGTILVGDTIISINGNKLRDRDDYYYRLRFAHPRLIIAFRRGGASSEAAAAAPPPTGAEVVTEALEKFLRRREGFQYLVSSFNWPAQQERSLGIVLANRMHRVIVGSLKAGSLGEEKLKVLDRIVAINGHPVSDKDIAKHLIVASGGKFSALVERPLTDEAKADFAMKSKAPGEGAAAAAPAVQFNDVGGDPSILPIDCLLITKQVREGTKTAPKAGILRGPQTLRSSSKIDINQGLPMVHAIASDVDPNKRLRRVPKG